MVRIRTSSDVDRFKASDHIEDRIIPSADKFANGQPAEQWKPTIRVGVWILTTDFYSGGRIHLYQMARAMAMNGCEVWMVTNKPPRWTADYPPIPTLHHAIIGVDQIPPDLDFCLTDAKNNVGLMGQGWKKRHPETALAVMSFETPNWVAKFTKEYSEALFGGADMRPIFRGADILVANSEESKKYLSEYVGKGCPPIYVCVPGINPASIEKASSARIPKIPYAVWSARSASYKGSDIVSEAIWNLDIPADLVLIGQGTRLKNDTPLHHLNLMPKIPDTEKMALLRDARVVLAPSLFEGFGMVPGEALSVGTPVIAYRLPVLEQNYGDRIRYAAWNDKHGFKRLVAEAFARPEKQIVPAEAIQYVRDYMGEERMASVVDHLPYCRRKRVSVTAYCISYWGFVPEAVEAIYPFVDQIVIAYGPVKEVLRRGVRPDGSLELIRGLPDPDHKISVEVRDAWADKEEMRRYCLSKVEGNHVLLLDGDEIWIGLDKWIESNSPYGSPRWVNLWHDAEHWIYDSGDQAGKRWGYSIEPFGSVCPHYRWSWWRRSFSLLKHAHPVDNCQRPLHSLAANLDTARACPDTVIYHLGHMLPKATMAAKHQFYVDRDGNATKERRDAWRNWKPVLGKFADGIVAAVDWTLPDVVARACARLAAPEPAKSIPSSPPPLSPIQAVEPQGTQAEAPAGAVQETV